MTLAEASTSHLLDKFILDSSLYVDDDSLVYEFLPPGARWDGVTGRMELRPELVAGDLLEREDVRTMKEIQQMADSICPVLQTSFDCPGLNQSGKMPLLDLQQWVEWVQREEGGGQWEILHEFYRKPCARRTVMLARSAMPDRCKRSTLTQEAVRILRNTSLSIPWARKAELLSDYSLRMKLSGYSATYRETIVRSALAAWEKQLEQDRTGEKPLYRERSWRKEERAKAKEKKRHGSHRQLGGTTNDFAVFCPMSPGGRLAERWRRVLEEVRANSGGLVRGYVAEQSGISLGALLYNNQPGEDDHCGQQDCNPCTSGHTKRLDCRKVALGGMVYSGQCTTCAKDGGEDPLLAYYHGETSRTLYTRQREHFSGLAAKKENNPLLKHTELYHPDTPPSFEFRAEKFFTDPCSKSIYEGVSINRSASTEGYLLNSKAEYKQGEVARVTIQRGLDT
jgi:hypothetical protein